MSESDWPLASPSPLSQCDYGEWSATQVLIPAIYILACVIGTFGNAFVLFAYLNGHGRLGATTNLNLPPLRVL